MSPTTMGVYRLRTPLVDSARRKAQDAANPLSFSGDLTPILDAAQVLADEEAANSQAVGCSTTDNPVAYFALRMKWRH